MRFGRSRASLSRHSLLVSRGVPVPVCRGVPLPLAFPCHWYSSPAPPTLPQRPPRQQPLCHCGVPCMPLRHCGAPARLFATAYRPASSSAAAPPASSLFATAAFPACLFTTAPRPATLPLRPSWSAALPQRPGQQKLRHSAGQQLRYGAPASNKPHPAEKSTPVWLAIWHIWAGFANSQQRCATSCSTY